MCRFEKVQRSTVPLGKQIPHMHHSSVTLPGFRGRTIKKSRGGGAQGHKEKEKEQGWNNTYWYILGLSCTKKNNLFPFRMVIKLKWLTVMVCVCCCSFKISNESSGCERAWMLRPADDRKTEVKESGAQTQTGTKSQTQRQSWCTISTPSVLQADTRYHYPGVGGNDGSAAVAVTGDPVRAAEG